MWMCLNGDSLSVPLVGSTRLTAEENRVRVGKQMKSDGAHGELQDQCLSSALTGE